MKLRFDERALLYSSLPYYIVPCLQLGFFYCKNPWIFLWISDALLPILDYYLPQDTCNPTKEVQKKLRKMFKFKIPLYLNLILDWIMLFWVLNYLTTSHESLSFIKLIGTIWLYGQFSLWNFNIAHELMHKNSLIDKVIGNLTLSKNLYMHFWIEHLFGHHKKVATKEDPATAKLNESVYSFFIRSIIDGYKSAWNIEKNRLNNKGKPVISLENKMLYYAVNNIISPSLVYWVYGAYGLLIFLVQAFISVLYLEVINYIEHYGLMRKEISPGVYEPVNLSHSWNSPHRFSNYLLFKLQRHSDHHENGSKPYQILCTHESSPTLPHGYSVCVLLALFPPIWFKIMNFLVLAYQQNITPTKEEKKAINRRILMILYAFCAFMTLVMVQETIIEIIILPNISLDGNIMSYFINNSFIKEL